MRRPPTKATTPTHQQPHHANVIVVLLTAHQQRSAAGLHLAGAHRREQEIHATEGGATMAPPCFSDWTTSAIRSDALMTHCARFNTHCMNCSISSNRARGHGACECSQQHGQDLDADLPNDEVQWDREHQVTEQRIQCCSLPSSFAVPLLKEVAGRDEQERQVDQPHLRTQWVQGHEYDRENGARTGSSCGDCLRTP